MPTISIVIPAYNAESVIAETLESVLVQTFGDWELVLIDDGSRDRTVDVVSGFARRDERIRVVTQTNTGVAGARNRGIAEASPDSVAVIFLDHDDLWRPDALAVLWEALQRNPAAVGVHALGLLVNTEAKGRTFTSHNGSTVDWRRRKMVIKFGSVRTVECSRVEPTTFNVQVYDGCVCTPGLMLVRHSALNKLGLFDPTVVPCDDWDMWVRLSLLGEVIFVDDILLNWCVYGGNASLNKEGMGRGVSQIRRKMFTLPGMSDEQRRLAHTRYRRMYASVERYNARDAAAWAVALLKQGRSKAALRCARISVERYALYISLCLNWGQSLDRGPIPSRLKDTAFPHELMNKNAGKTQPDGVSTDIGSHSQF